jgi:hypothetical protein
MIAFFIISSCSNNNSNDLPTISSLDSLANLNSDKLYDWDIESYTHESNIKNSNNLEIKINRKVLLKLKNKEYILLPFFIKGKSNSKILMLHILVLDGNFNLKKLESVSFNDLTRIDKTKEYYYFN